MLYLSASEGQPSKVCPFVSSLTYSKGEMDDHHGLCDKSSQVSQGNNVIWVITDRLTKQPILFLSRWLINISISQEIHIENCEAARSSKQIVSDRDTRFRLYYWTNLIESLRMHLDFPLVYHSQTNGKSERIIQT